MIKRRTASILATSIVLLFTRSAIGFQKPGVGSTLEVSCISVVGGEQKAIVDVNNSQELVAMDIPLRYGRPGDPVILDRVEWTNRVDGWDLRHASIDNVNKTVILGLISDLTGERKDSALAVAGEGDASIATLVFQIEGDFRLSLETFTTTNPTHALTFIYNERDRRGRPHVVEFTPGFHADLTEKK